MNTSLANLSAQQLRRAAAIKDQIESLEKESGVDERPAQTDRLTNRERQLVDYYDRLADNYDSNRFGNSYGRYVDAQERRLLKRWLNQVYAAFTMFEWRGKRVVHAI